MFMMLLGILMFESGCRGRSALSKGIEAGMTTAVKARDENRVKLAKMIRLIVLSRYLSMMSIKDTQILKYSGLLTIFKTPHFACKFVFLLSERQMSNMCHLICAAVVEALGGL